MSPPRFVSSTRDPKKHDSTGIAKAFANSFLYDGDFYLCQSHSPSYLSKGMAAKQSHFWPKNLVFFKFHIARFFHEAHDIGTSVIDIPQIRQVILVRRHTQLSPFSEFCPFGRDFLAPLFQQDRHLFPMPSQIPPGFRIDQRGIDAVIGAETSSYANRRRHAFLAFPIRAEWESFSEMDDLNVARRSISPPYFRSSVRDPKG